MDLSGLEGVRTAFDDGRYSSRTERMQESMGKDAFLKLLVTQLEHQDPLNPMDNTEFVAQLAQFSSLEGINNLGSSMDGMAGSIRSMQDMAATNLIGRHVMTEGNSFDFSGNPVGFGFELEGEAAKVLVKIFDAAGRPVRELTLGQLGAGEHDAVWDGTDYAGNASPSGLYRINVEAIGQTGKRVASTPYTVAQVTSMSLGPGGAELNAGGRTITEKDIRRIY